MASLEQIQAKMKKLQAQAEAMAAKKAQAVVDQIRALMLKHGLTTADIEAKASAKRAVKRAKGSAAGKTKTTAADKTKAAPKYLNPKTGATWTGHGRAPAWIAEAKDRNKFLIAGGAEATVAASADAGSKAKTAVKKTAPTSVGTTVGKGQPKGPQPALYRDPKSGATWSGRGRAPAWLATVKERSKFLIDGATAAADAKPAATSAVATKGAIAKKTAAKKAVSAKVPAKKAAAKSTAPGAVKKASAKNAPRKAAAMPTPVAAVESGAELTS